MTLSDKLRRIDGHIDAKTGFVIADLAGRIAIAAALGIETRAIRVVFDHGRGKRQPVYARPPLMEEQAIIALGGAEAVRRLSGLPQGDDGVIAPLMTFIRMALDHVGRERYAQLVEHLADCTMMVGLATPLPPFIPAAVPDAETIARLTALLKENASGR